VGQPGEASGARASRVALFLPQALKRFEQKPFGVCVCVRVLASVCACVSMLALVCVCV